MHKSHRSIAAIAVFAALEMAAPANAQRHPAALGALMTAFVQPRHIKLGLAGSERNWSYAAYELDQLRATFADVAEIMPKYRDLSSAANTAIAAIARLDVVLGEPGICRKQLAPTRALALGPGLHPAQQVTFSDDPNELPVSVEDGDPADAQVD